MPSILKYIHSLPSIAAWMEVGGSGGRWEGLGGDWGGGGGVGGGGGGIGGGGGRDCEGEGSGREGRRVFFNNYRKLVFKKAV